MRDTIATDQTILVIASLDLGEGWRADIAMFSENPGGFLRLFRDGKVVQRLTFCRDDLCAVLAAMQLTATRLDDALDQLNGAPLVTIERRPLIVTGCTLFTMAALNDASGVAGVCWQLGWIEDGLLVPFGGRSDNFTVPASWIPLLASLAHAAAEELHAGAAVARRLASPVAGSCTIPECGVTGRA